MSAPIDPRSAWEVVVFEWLKWMFILLVLFLVGVAILRLLGL